MKKVLCAALLAGLLTGCSLIEGPPVKVWNPESQQYQTLTEAERLEIIERDYQAALAQIENLQRTAAWLPPGTDLAAVGLLGTLSAYLERRRRQLVKEVQQEKAKVPSGA